MQLEIVTGGKAIQKFSWSQFFLLKNMFGILKNKIPTIPTAIAKERNVIPSLGWSHIANSASLSVVVRLSTKGDHDTTMATMMTTTTMITTTTTTTMMEL